MTTKEQERKALDKIKEILSTLEHDSYVNTAFKGCVERAEVNIENDFACSLMDVLNSVREKLSEQKHLVEELQNSNRDLHAENNMLIKRIDNLLEWNLIEESGGISTAWYETLKSSCTKALHETECANLLQDHGFDKYKVTILYKTTEYEKNRLGHLRKHGEVERCPYYYASDYNYILFECGGYTHALINGTVHFNI